MQIWGAAEWEKIIMIKKMLVEAPFFLLNLVIIYLKYPVR